MKRRSENNERIFLFYLTATTIIEMHISRPECRFLEWIGKIYCLNSMEERDAIFSFVISVVKDSGSPKW
jgi:hypothetical protein